MSFEERLFIWLRRRRDARRDRAAREHHVYVPPDGFEDRCAFVTSDDGNWGQHHCSMPREWHTFKGPTP